MSSITLTNLYPFLLVKHFLCLFHPKLLHSVNHPDHVLPHHGGVGPHDHPPGPLVSQDFFLKVQVKVTIKALKGKSQQSTSIAQRAAVEIIAGN